MSSDGESWKIEAAKVLSDQRDKLMAERKALIDSHQRQIRQIDDKIGELFISARSLDLRVPWLAEDAPNINSVPNVEMPGVSIKAVPPVRKPFKERALELLAEAYPKPLKASEIQKKIEKEYRAKYHDKTAGMSLYRLSNDGAVRREGHFWFYIVPEQRLVEQNKEGSGFGDQPDDPEPSIFD